METEGWVHAAATSWGRMVAHGLELVSGESVGPLCQTLSPSPYMVGLELKPTQSDSQICACAMSTMATRSMWETLHLIPSHSCQLDVSFLYRRDDEGSQRLNGFEPRLPKPPKPTVFPPLPSAETSVGAHQQPSLLGCLPDPPHTTGTNLHRFPSIPGPHTSQGFSAHSQKPQHVYGNEVLFYTPGFCLGP